MAGSGITDDPMNLERVFYIDECNKRWIGPALSDARRNWHMFQEIQLQLIEALTEYRRDPFHEDIAERCQNPEGTLTAFLWKLQTAITPDRSCLYPLLDFEEHFQKVFLKRGLIIFCAMILHDMEANTAAGSDMPLFASAS